MNNDHKAQDGNVMTGPHDVLPDDMEAKCDKAQAAETILREAIDSFATLASVLTARQILSASQWAAPDGGAADEDQLDSEWVIGWTDGVPNEDRDLEVKPSYVMWLSDYPEEGCLPLDAEGEPSPAPAASEPIGWRFRIFMDSGWQLAELPAPTNRRFDFEWQYVYGPQLPPAPAASEPEAWSDDQMVRFAWSCINPALVADSIRERLHQFRGFEAVRAAPQPPAASSDALDAARYRWLRSIDSYAEWNRVGHCASDALDASIDAAIKGEQS